MSEKPVTSLPEKGSVDATEGSHIHPVSKPAVIHRTAPKPRLRTLGAPSNETLPDVLVGPFAAADMPLVELLDELSYDSGVAFAFGGDELREKKLSLVDPSQQPFGVAIARIASASDLFWSYDGGVLKLEPTRSYALEVPQVAGVAEALKTAVEGVGATDIVQSSASGGLVFNASPSVARKVAGVVDEWASKRSMIVYDGHIFEVSRSRSGEAGISLEALKQKLASIANAQITDDGDGFAVTSEASELALDIVLSELQKSSSSRVLSQPTLAVVSGGSAMIDVGSKQKYISSLENSTGENGSSKVTVDEVSSGIELEVTGEHSGGVITTELELKLSTLLGFQEFDTGSARLKLPSTAERTISQTLLGRPGDTLVLAGVMTDSVEEDASGMRGQSTKRSQESSVDELIVVLRPRLVTFK